MSYPQSPVLAPVTSREAQATTPPPIFHQRIQYGKNSSPECNSPTAILPSTSSISLLSLSIEQQQSESLEGLSPSRRRRSAGSLVTNHSSIFTSPTMVATTSAAYMNSAHHRRISHYRRQFNNSTNTNNTYHTSYSASNSPLIEPISLGSSPVKLILEQPEPITRCGDTVKPIQIPGKVLNINTSVQPNFIASSECQSPTLPPVATPLEEPPMTPMVLSEEDPN